MEIINNKAYIKTTLKDMTGQRFGILTVLEHIGIKNKDALWKCKCDCGKETQVVRSSLVRGFTTSCGCIRKEKARERKLGIFEDTKQKLLDNSIRNSNGCLIWQGCVYGSGYGKISYKGESMGTHRASYLIFKGEIPKIDEYHGTCVCHTCDNALCIEPNHLFLGTQKDNIQDCIFKNRFNPGGYKS
jgi:hypothetical protein